MTINLNRCSFLSAALAFIRLHPGCCKKQVVTMHGSVPTKTYSYRNAALNRLLRAGLVRNAGGKCGAYSLYAN